MQLLSGNATCPPTQHVGMVLRIAASLLWSRPVCYNDWLFKVACLGDGGDRHVNRWLIMSAVNLVDAAIEDRRSFKKIGTELDSMPPDHEATQRLISAHHERRCEPWLSAYLLGCIGHRGGYATAKSILLSNAGSSSESYAAVAMAKILGEAAYEDLRQVLFSDHPLKVRRGAASGMATTSSPRRLDDFFAAVIDGLLTRNMAAWYIADCNPGDDWLLRLLRTSDVAQQKLGSAIIELMVAHNSNRRVPGTEVAECIRELLDNESFSMNPKRRKNLRHWVDSIGIRTV